MKNLAQKFQNVTFYEWQVAQMGEFGEQMNEILAYAKGLDIRDGFNSVKDDESYTNKILKAYFERGHTKLRQKPKRQAVFRC